MRSPDELYYRMGLVLARDGNLTGAAGYARAALEFNPDHEKAHKLIQICLEEMGFSPEGSMEGLMEGSMACPIMRPIERRTHSETLLKLKRYFVLPEGKNAEKGLFSRYRAMRLLKKIPGQDARLLNIRGCAWAVLEKYEKSALSFADALKKDKGNKLSSAGLSEALARLRENKEYKL